MPIIPYKNPTALVGYYLGVASLLPLLGFLTAVPAVICGVIGIIMAGNTPEIGGKGHAITAIALGVMGPVLWVVAAGVLELSLPW